MTSEVDRGIQQLKARAAACYDAGDLPGALQCFRRLLGLLPNDPEVLNDAGTVSYALSLTDQARGYYVRALRADPSYAPARRNLEMLCCATGMRFEELLREAEGRPRSVRDISVVVPLNSRFDVFAHCLEGLANQTFAPERYEVLAVANGVGPDQMAELRRLIDAWQGRYGGRLRLVEVEQASIALARNAGIREAEGAVIMQINEDAVLSRTALEQHWAAHEGFGFNPRCVLLGGREFPDAYRRRLFNYLYEAAALYMPLHQPRPRFMGDYQWFVTCNLSCLAEAYERFGCYDPAYAWGSDTELGRRWEQAGFMDLYVDTSIRGYHLHELTFEGYRNNCIKRAPFQFRREAGHWPSEATPDEREEARLALGDDGLDVAAFEADLVRLEQEFPGPDAFAGTSVMGKPARTLREFNYLVTPLLKAYRKHLHYAELVRLMELGVEEAAAG
jgi:GT2 family glycosyltransferase